MSAGSSGGLTGAGGSTSNMVHSQGCWLEASVPCHRGLFMGYLIVQG